MAEVAAGYAVERAVEGGAAAAYAIAKNTLPLKGAWKRIGADSPLPRSSHSLVVVAGKAYVFGGEIEPRQPVDNDVHVYTLPSGIMESTDYSAVKSESAPPPRVGHTAVAIGQWMYVFGGRGGKEMKPLDEGGRVWCFDTKTSAWSALDPSDKGPVPDPRSYHASAATEHPLPSKTAVEKDAPAAAVEQHGTVFVHAGCPTSGRLADLWAFDVAARVWRKLPDAPGPPRGSPGLACTSKQLFRFGGFNGNDQEGGQIDVLDLGKETFDDQSGAAEVAVIASPKYDGQWRSLKFDSPDAPHPGNRSVTGMHPITTGQGRNYLILLLGEKSPSANGHDAAGKFWDDVWAFQILPDGMSGASFKDAARMAIGMKTREYDWSEVQIPEASKSEGRAAMPGARGWFASSACGDLDSSAILLWGGINSNNERLDDGYMLSVELA